MYFGEQIEGLLENCPGHRLQRQDLVYAAQLYGLLGHSKDHASGFVLGNGCGSGLLHLQHSASAVVAHSCQNDADSVSSGIAGRGTEDCSQPSADWLLPRKPVASLRAVFQPHI